MAIAAGLASVLTWYALGTRITLRHEAYVNEATAVRAVFCPATVQDYVSRFTPGAVNAVSGLSKLNTAYSRLGNYDWVHYLPLEFTFLFAQTSSLALDATLFVQEHPNGPPFAPVLNSMGFFRFLTAFAWNPPQLREDGDGYLVARGRIPLAPPVQDYIGAQWPSFHLPETVEPSGDHLLELTADNRNGVMAELHLALDSAHPSSRGLGALVALHNIWPYMQALHFTAGLVEDDHVAMHAEVALSPTVSLAERQVVTEGLEAAALGMEAHLREVHGFTLVYALTPASSAVEVELHMRGFQRLLERARG